MKFEPSAVPFYSVHITDVMVHNFRPDNPNYRQMVMASDYRALLLRYNLALSLLEMDHGEPDKLAESGRDSPESHAPKGV
jgi:hypothetical protein